MLVAHRLFLDAEPDGRRSSSTRSPAAALGGFDSPIGAVVGGWIVGVTEALAGTYIDVDRLRPEGPGPLGLIFVVLLVRPAGLFGSPEVTRA